MRKRIQSLGEKYIPKLVGFGLNSWALIQPDASAVKAFNIFCTPRKGRVQSWQKKFLKKFKLENIHFDDLEISAAYYVYGDGPKTILLCHGWESNSFRWRKLFKYLKDLDYKIVMVDGPGHGATTGNKFNALLYTRIINGVAEVFNPEIIIGHSIGGYASLLYTANYQPSFIKKIVILASPNKLSDITTTYFNILGLSKKMQRHYYKFFNKHFGNIEDYSAENFVEKIKQPGIIIHDRNDKINGFEDGAAIAESWKGGQLYEVEGLDHSLQGKEVFEKVVEYINQ